MIENTQEINKISSEIHNKSTPRWINYAEKNSYNLSSILNIMNNIQSELLQAQIDLQDGQHQIKKIETILEIDYKNINISSLLNTIEINKNNDYESKKVIDLQNELILIRNDNQNIKNHLESVINSNSQLQNGITLIENEMRRKDKLIVLLKEEKKNILFDKKNLESRIDKFNADDLSKSKYQSNQEELQKHIKEAEKTIKCYKEKNNNLESQIEFTKHSVKNGIRSYEDKVTTIIEEIKKQKQFIEEENKKLTDGFEKSRKDLCESQEHCELMSLKLLNKEDEIFQLKSKLADKNQLEEREKLFRREIDENINQIKNFKSQILNLNSEKETFYKKICEQDSTLCKLMDEIQSLHKQMKSVKNQTYEQNIYNDSIYSSTGHPNQSTPSIQSTMEDLNEQSQSPINYRADHLIENNAIIYQDSNEDLNNNSDFDSTEDNTIKKLATLLKSQTDHSKNYLNICGMNEMYSKKDQNSIFLIDDFSKYLEEQLQLIKIANEKNMISIKRELTIK